MVVLWSDDVAVYHFVLFGQTLHMWGFCAGAGKAGTCTTVDYIDNISCIAVDIIIMLSHVNS